MKGERIEPTAEDMAIFERGIRHRLALFQNQRITPELKRRMTVTMRGMVSDTVILPPLDCEIDF